jgi:cellulose synthase/poly-beta-1,6-N-acetylglucosamine synthase-like glycosyltransferase
MFLFLTILINYIIFIGLLIYGFNKVKTHKNNDLQPNTTFSIIVPFRNEAANIFVLLDSISKLNYPKNLFEIIFVDDFSDDNSARIYNQWRIKNGLIESTLLENIRLSNSPKKDAITRAVHIVKNEWIVTTDADCIVNPNWLSTLDNYIQNNACQMIAGAVSYTKINNPLNYFQFIDMISLQGTTIGSFGLEEPFMCNGANFAYTKKLFLDLKGFDGNNNLASGDDVFLLQKAVENNIKVVHYLKHFDAIVLTKPEKSIAKIFMQRVRWASKTGSYNSDFSKGLAVIVLLMNASIVLGCGLWIMGYLNQYTIYNLQFAIFIKFLIDYILLWKTNKFIRKSNYLLPIISSLVYPFYATIVGIYSLFGSFSWKGRDFKK